LRRNRLFAAQGDFMPWMDDHSFVFGSFYGLIVCFFPARARRLLWCFLTGIPTNRELSQDLVALQRGIQLIGVNRQRLRKARLTGLWVQMDNGQYPLVNWKGNAFQKLLVRFYVILACWQHLIELAKDKGLPKGHFLLARAYGHRLLPGWRRYRPIRD
jgi:hypothetical protein